MNASSEKQGVFFTIGSAALWGIYPIVVHSYAHQISPFLFAGILSLFTAAGMFLWMNIRKKVHELKRTQAYFPLFMVSICVIVIPSAMFFVGIQYTNAINSSVLMLSEILFTLIFTPFFGERNTLEKYIGTLGIMIGGAMVLYNGTEISLNFGDILIILSTVTFPIGNFYSKRALYIISPSTVIMVRYLLGSVFLLLLAFFIEPNIQIINTISDNFFLFFIIGFVLLSFCKVSFYEGMKRLDISKVISLEMTYPFFSLMVLLLFFDSQVKVYQVIGIFIMVLGSIFSVRRKSENHLELKYIPKSK